MFVSSMGLVVLDSYTPMKFNIEPDIFQISCEMFNGACQFDVFDMF